MIRNQYLLLAFVALAADGSPSAAPAPPPPDRATVIENIMGATVMIEGSGVYGAGILVDPRTGLVLTSEHVVEDMKSPQVTTRSGKKGTAKVLAQDDTLDLALLSVPDLADAEAAAPRLIEPSALHAGDEVFAIGMPRKLPFTLSHGVVSDPLRDMDGVNHVQVDMNINDGNSGGPVFTASGEIVGVMSFIVRRAQGLAFAVPISDATAAFPKQLAHPRAAR